MCSILETLYCSSNATIVGGIYVINFVRLEKFQFLEKGQNRNFGYKIVISVKNPEFIL